VSVRLRIADWGLRIGGRGPRPGGRRVHSAIRNPQSAILLLLVSACEPSARKALLLDLTLTDPLALESTASSWRDAGYTIDYRRFYPHLTRADLGSYHALLLLGGREPERASDRVSLGDLAVLSEWLARGGVVVFAYAGDGEGFFDRWVMNRWLASQGTGIVIGDFPLRDTTRGPGGALEPQPPVVPRRPAPLHNPGFDPFPAGRNHVLLVDDDRQVLARSTEEAFVRPAGKDPEPRPRSAVVAASRVGAGLVVVASRHALAAPGPELRAATAPLARAGDDRATRVFLRALARWTRRPAEWASVPPARPGPPLTLREAPLPVALRPPRLAPPAGAEALLLSKPQANDREQSAVGVSGWITRQGMRVFWGDLRSIATFQPAGARARELDSLLGFLEAGAVTALAVAPQAAALGDTARFARWERDYAAAVSRQLVDRLQTSSVRWIPVIRPASARVRVDTSARGIRGDSLTLWCALGTEFWNAALAPAYRSVARLAAQRPDLVPAVVLDLSLPDGGYTMGHDFCDATYRAALGAMELDGTRLTSLAALPVEVRYDSLLDAGLLAAYYGSLERLVAARAGVLRREARAFAPELVFAFKSHSVPADWFTLGLLAGFGGAGPPLLLWTHEPHGRALAASYRGRGIRVLHAMGIAPAALGAGAWARLRYLVFEESDGFWLSAEPDARAPNDSVARLIRRLSR
jgi:hypothetical protein